MSSPIQDVSLLVPPELPEPRKHGNAEEAGEAFEAYLVSFLCKQIRESVPEGMLNSGAMGVFGGFFDQEIGQRVADGGGLGLAEQVSGALGEVPLALARAAGHFEGHRGGAGGRISSGFGHRRDPFGGERAFHAGVDVAAPSGTTIRAIRAGRVVFAGDRGGLGRAVVIDHGDGLRSLYGHCEGLDVEVGERVGPGDRVARVGTTGRTTGPHVHFELRKDGVAVDPADHFNVMELRDIVTSGASPLPTPGSVFEDGSP